MADSSYRLLVYGLAAASAAACTYYIYKSLAKLAEAEDTDALAGSKHRFEVAPVNGLGPTPKRFVFGPAPAAGPAAPAVELPQSSAGASPTLNATDPTPPSQAQNGKHCSHCHKAATATLLRCSRCKSVSYCGQECQRFAWPAHKKECRRLAAGQGATHADPVQHAISEQLALSVAKSEDALEKEFQSGVLMFVNGNAKPALQHFNKAFELAVDAEQKDVQADLKRWMGHSHLKLGDTEAAAESFHRGHAIAQSIANKKLQIDNLSGLGVMLQQQGKLEQSVKHFNEALDLAQHMEEDQVIAQVLSHLGAALVRSDTEKAVEHLERATGLQERQAMALKERDDMSGFAAVVLEQAATQLKLGEALSWQGRWERCEEVYGGALGVFELFGDAEKVPGLLANLANITEIKMHREGCSQSPSHYRRRLFAFLETHGGWAAPAAPRLCGGCGSSIDIAADGPKGTAGAAAASELMVLPCLHVLHEACWAKRQEQEPPLPCPTCGGG